MLEPRSARSALRAVHGADHLRRGFDVLTDHVFWAGNLQIFLAVVTLVLIVSRNRFTPVAAVVVGFASAIGFTAAHLVPHWSAFSDSFTGSHSAPHVTWFSWFAALFEIGAGLLLGAAGVRGPADADANGAGTMTAVPTPARIRTAAGELFRRQGYTATGVKQIVTEAAAPLASLYHFFPGGKEELGADVIRTSGVMYQELVEAVWDAAPDVITAVRDVFTGAAATLVATDYADACPIATVALEVASTNETLRVATAEVFDAWIASATARLAAAGIDADESRRCAFAIIALLEGAFVLARAARSVEPLTAAGSTAVGAVEQTLARSRA